MITLTQLHLIAAVGLVYAVLWLALYALWVAALWTGHLVYTRWPRRCVVRRLMS